MIQHLSFKKKHFNLILIIYFAKLLSAHGIEHDQHNLNTTNIQTYNNQIVDQHKNLKIYIQSDSAEICYPNKIQLFGHVNIRQQYNIIKSDKLTIFQNNDFPYSILYADGNVYYDNKHIVVTGDRAQFTPNNDINIYKSKFYLKKIHIHGTANSIMQRKNNRYTILKHGNFTNCIVQNNCWNITGSKIIYDHHYNNINIWKACLKIKSIPIFYSPYLSFSYNNKKFINSYIPNLQYHNKQGLILKIPFPLNFFKHHKNQSYLYYLPNYGIRLKTKTFYSIKPGTGSIIFNIIEYNKNHHNRHHNNLYELHWQHNGIINKKWHTHINYVLYNKNYYFKNVHTQHTNNYFDHDINRNILFYYNNKYSKISLAYLKNKPHYNSIKKTIINNYAAAPQLELHLYHSFSQLKSMNLHIFNQISQFIPENQTDYPKSIRIHTEPIIHYSLHNHFIKLNAESKLKITYYYQKNINNYNLHQNKQYQLQKTIKRIIPQFRISGNTLFQRNSNTTQKYKYFLKPKLQYLYIPYCFQENIGIYDTKIIYINHKNLFYDTQCSGLDRILPLNQITSSIEINCFNTEHNLFYISVGQIFNFPIYHKINNKNIKPHNIFNTTFNTQLFSGSGCLNINNYWNIQTEIQYDPSINKPISGNASLEYTGKNNQIFQTHYRYINSKCFQENFIQFENLNPYHQTISQLNIFICYPIIKNWKINYTYCQNLKNNNLIRESIGIQYFNQCWIFNLILERKITDWNNTFYINTYDNKIKFNFNLYHFQKIL